MTHAKKLYIIIFVFLVAFIGLTIYHYYPYKLEHIGYTEKIWAHRVNSLEKLDYTQGKYSGIEFDVVFDSSTHTFDITHPPTPSIGLTLEKYLEQIDNPSLGLWIDFKNLNTSNNESSLNRMLELADYYNLNKKQIIVESQNPMLLQPFAVSGFQTSYYLPSHLHQLSKEELNKKIDEIRLHIEQFPTTYISTNIEDYKIINTYFPQQNKLLWSLFTTYNKKMFSNYQLTKLALKDELVFVILTRVNRNKGRR